MNKSGKRLHDFRISIDLPQMKLAKMTGIRIVEISYMEIGHKPVSEELADSISRIYNVNKEWLLYGVGDMYL